MEKEDLCLGRITGTPHVNWKTSQHEIFCAGLACTSFLENEVKLNYKVSMAINECVYICIAFWFIGLIYINVILTTAVRWTRFSFEYFCCWYEHHFLCTVSFFPMVMRHTICFEEWYCLLLIIVEVFECLQS